MHVIHTFTGHKGPVYDLILGTEKETFLSGSGDGKVVRWSIQAPDQGEVLATVDQAIFSLFLEAGTGMLLIGTEGGDLHVVDVNQGREIHRFQVHQKGIFRIIDLGDGKVACAGGDGCLSIWRANVQAPGLAFLRNIPIMEGKIRDLALSPDGGSLALACGDGTIRILETVHFNEIGTLEHPDIGKGSIPVGYSGVAYHPAKPVLLSGGKDGHLRAWHTGEGYRQLHALPAHKGGIYRIVFHPGKAIMATASRDKTAKIWDPQALTIQGKLDRAAGGHTHSVNSALWVGDLLITAGDDRSVLAWR